MLSNISKNLKNLNCLKVCSAAAFSSSKLNFNKVCESAEIAVSDMPNGASLMLGGFGICGICENLCKAVAKKKVKELNLITNTPGMSNFGVGELLNE